MDITIVLDKLRTLMPNPMVIQLMQWIDQLRNENESLRRRVAELEEQLSVLARQSADNASGVPCCPNCSTASKKVFMSPVPPDFVEMVNATHECQACRFKKRFSV